MATFKLVKGEDVPKEGTFTAVDQAKMVASHGPRLGTTGLGPCMALAAFGLDKGDQPMMGLWHIDAPQISEFGGIDNTKTIDGAIGVIAHFKKFLIAEGMKEESLEVNVVGGPDTFSHKAFKLLFKDKADSPKVWEGFGLGQITVPFKEKNGYDGSAEVYLEHPKTILITFFCHALLDYRC